MVNETCDETEITDEEFIAVADSLKSDRMDGLLRAMASSYIKILLKQRNKLKNDHAQELNKVFDAYAASTTKRAEVHKLNEDLFTQVKKLREENIKLQKKAEGADYV